MLGTEPLPNEREPITVARLWSWSAPATTSAPAAVPPLISTMRGLTLMLERISLSGPPVALQPDLARAFALVIHELATNAAKYGSLSSAAGRLAINWNFDNNAVALTWMECGGPSVLPPAKVGFGTTLIKSLQQFGSVVDLDFRPTGLVCSVRFEVPTDGAPSSS
jgi:two-component sensor histidine kinase